MARHSRKKSESGIFHIILRGINKQTIFEDNSDRKRFLETVSRFKSISKFELYGYCLMDNHVHLLIKETQEEISKIIKRISSSYVFWYNIKYSRCGHLFQERYKSEAVQDDIYLLNVLRYIHQNPVKAGLVKNVHEYKWSSYSEYVNEAHLTDTDFILKLLSDSRENSIASFVEYTSENIEGMFLEIIEKSRVLDSDLKEYFRRFDIENISDLQHMDKNTRNEYICKLKSIEGVTVRQLSRVTGISKSIIGRIQ